MFPMLRVRLSDLNWFVLNVVHPPKPTKEKVPLDDGSAVIVNGQRTGNEQEIGNLDGRLSVYN
jgi:hypothetical protein